MKKGLLLSLLACALLCGGVLWVWLRHASPPTRGPEVLESAARPAEHAGARPSEKLQVEPVAKSEPAAPAAGAPPEPAQPAAEPRLGGPTPPAAGFMPYPNAGASDFKLKYDGLALAALAKAKAALQQQLNDELARLSEDRFARGLFEERVIDPRKPGGELKEVKAPEGLGEVRGVQKTAMQADGTFKNQTTFLTQSEQPEFFAHQAEFNYVANAWKQAGGH